MSTSDYPTGGGYTCGHCGAGAEAAEARVVEGGEMNNVPRTIMSVACVRSALDLFGVFTCRAEKLGQLATSEQARTPAEDAPPTEGML